MQPEIQNDGKKEQVSSKLTVLELMTVLAVLGVLLTWVIDRFFLS